MVTHKTYFRESETIQNSMLREKGNFKKHDVQNLCQLDGRLDQDLAGNNS
jgi:hypothetical protein